MSHPTNSASVALPEVSRVFDIPSLLAKYGDATGRQHATPSARPTVNGSSMLANLPHVQFGAGTQQPAVQPSDEAQQPAPADLSGLATLCAAEFEPVDGETAQRLEISAVLAEWGGDHERAAELRAKAEDAPDEQDNVAEIGTLANLEHRAEQQMLAMSRRYAVLVGETLKVLDIHTGQLLGVESFRLQASGPAETGGFPPVVKATQKSKDEFEERRAKKQDFKNTFIPKTEPVAAGTAFLQWTRGIRVQRVVMLPVPGGREVEFNPRGQVFNRFPCVWENRPIKPTNQVVMKRTTPHDPRIKPLFDHLLFLAGGDEMAVCCFLYYLAWLYQHPGDKIPWAPLLCSEKTRLGKSTLFYIIADVFGGRDQCLVTECSGAQLKNNLEGQFTESFDVGWLKFVHELPPLGNPLVLDGLKSLVSESSGESRHMREGAKQTDRRIQFLFTTNQKAALPGIVGLGRFLVLGTDADPMPPEYYRELFGWTGGKKHTGPGAQALADVLHEMGFPPEWDHNAPPPVTDYARQMDKAALSQGAEFLQARIMAREGPFAKDFQSGRTADNLALVDAVKNMHRNHNSGYSEPKWLAGLTTQKLGAMLSELGCKKLSRKLHGDSSNPPWCWRNFAQWNQKSIKTEAMRQHLEDGSRPFSEPKED